MYGLIGQILAAPGKRAELLAILAQATESMPGCLTYIIAEDTSNRDALWVTEVWDRKESHEASLSLPAVQAAIGQAKPLIAGFGARIETVPVAGIEPSS